MRPSVIAELKKKQKQNDQNPDGKGGSIRKELPPTTIAPSRSNWTAPDGFICPLTKHFMTNPVMAADNHSYEREAIEDLLKSSDISPTTGKKLPNRELIPNHNLKQVIQKFIEMSEGKVVANWEELDGIKCSITGAIMKEPFIAVDGHSYEARDIQRWLLSPGTKKNSPKTLLPLSTVVTRPNTNLKLAIQFFARKTEAKEVIFESAAMQHQWASDYYNGQGVTQDLKAAVLWFSKAAQQGHQDALYYLGGCYAKGLGVELNDKEAVHWFSQAAKLDHAEAQLSLGTRFMNGNGVIRDGKQAAYWLRRSNTLGSPTAAYHLGLIYTYGLDVEKNLEQAELWHCKAASGNSVEAQFMLGLSYEYGLLGKKNYEQAVRWYVDAVRNGYQDARFHLDLCFIMGRGKSEIEKRMPEYKLTPWPSETQFLWAKKYFEGSKSGSGLPKDLEKAKYLFQQAAKQGHREAQYHIAECCMNGTGGMAKDEKAAVQWYRSAAGQKHPQAQLRLGQFYAQAQGESNLQQAIYWYQQAATGGDSEAVQILQNMHQVAQNPSQNRFTTFSEDQKKFGDSHRTSTTSSMSTTSFGKK